MITGTVISAQFNAALDGIREALIGAGKDVQMLLIDEHRRLTNLIVNFVPPPKSVGGQKAGEGAVKKDLYSLISEAEEATLQPIMDKYGTKDIDTYLTTRSGDKLELKWDNIAIGSAAIAELHNAYRNSRGTITRRKPAEGVWKSRIVVAKGVRDEYVVAIQARVGRMKAKWAYAASVLGAKFPAYISRHFGSIQAESIAQFKLSSSTPGTDSITFGGSGRGFGQTRDAVRDAMRIRAGQIAKRTKLVISGYAKDIAQGIRPKPHAAETAEPEEATE